MTQEETEPTVVQNNDNDNDSDENWSENDPYFPPLMQLPEIDLKTLEEDEEELWKHRGQLYRFEGGDSEQGGEWKQRGTGVLKLLKHKHEGYVRILMRRDVTLKVCANHYVLPIMPLRQHPKSDRTWVWHTPADFADEEAKEETLAIRFKDVETFQDFQTHIEIAKEIMREYQAKILGNTNGEGEGVLKTEEEEKEEKLVNEVEALSVS